MNRNLSRRSIESYQILATGTRSDHGKIGRIKIGRCQSIQVADRCALTTDGVRCAQATMSRCSVMNNIQPYIESSGYWVQVLPSPFQFDMNTSGATTGVILHEEHLLPHWRPYFVPCDGRLLSKVEYPGAYALFGHVGYGETETHFNVPNRTNV